MESLESLTPINKTRLYQEAVWRIKELIAEGYYKPGSKLPSNRELAKRLSVSRAVISEALTILNVMGLIDIKPGSGTYVADLTNNGVKAELLDYILSTKKWMIEDLTELRLIIEPDIARLAAERREDKDIQKMKDIIEQMKRKVEAGELGVDESMNFHLYLVRTAQNEIILRIMLLLQILLKQSREESLLRKERPQKAIREHEKILDAVIKRDGKEAQRMMELHLQNIVDMF